MPSVRTATERLSILRDVSRSFYLSIRLLPPELREPVGLAYLLARASDTIADTAPLPAAQRRDQLQTLSHAIQGDDAARARLPAVWEAFAPLQKGAGEQALIRQLEPCVALLDAVDTTDRADIRKVLGEITRGQLLDLDRFADAAEVRALASAQELHEYTWLVAGCVGEFWTALCVRHIPDFASLPATEMRPLGVAYGQGLQLINILRDAGIDLASGRCYFPADELAALGMAPADVAREPRRFAPVMLRWQGVAEEHLRQGMRYALAVRPRRARAASALPALIGARTLALLREAGPAALTRPVKVPRAKVRALLVRLALTFASASALARDFERSLPMGQSAP